MAGATRHEAGEDAAMAKAAVVEEGDGIYRFVSGAGMAPSLVRARFPGGRFVARARLDDAGDAGEDPVWGLLIRLAAAGNRAAADATRPVVTDDGRRFVAAVADGGRPDGEPAAILTAAQYWELSPAYVRRLAAAAENAGDAASSGDGEG